MDRLVRLIFSWERLRDAVFEEVHLYDMLTERMEDYNPDHNTMVWNEWDGWRSKSYSEEEGRFYFNDVPSDSFLDVFEQSIR